MKFVSNAGIDTVLEVVRPALQSGTQLDLVSPTLSLFAFAQLRADLAKLSNVRLLIPADAQGLQLQGAQADRAARNKLQSPWLARLLAQWIANKAQVRFSSSAIPQGAMVVRDVQSSPIQAIVGSFALSLAGLGITPGNPLNLIQASETADQALQLSQWFEQQWMALHDQPEAKAAFIARQPMGRLAQPDEIAALVVYLASDESAFVTGQAMLIDGGMSV